VSELHDIYESGDYIHVKDTAGRIFVYVVRYDGAVILLHDPTGAQVNER
jgi:hypothetical protein